MFGKRRRRYEAQLDAEMRDHLDRRIADLLARGMTADEARRQTLAEFGGVELAKEECRDVHPWRAAISLGRDSRQALRTLRRSPLFAAVAVLVLGFALAANLTAFTWVDALFLRPLPVDAPDELVQIWTTDATGAQLDSFSKAMEVLRTEPVFSGTCAFEEFSYPMETDGALRSVVAQAMSWDCFETLGIRVQRGRVFTQAEDLRSEQRVALVSDALWRTDFAANPDVVGREIRYGGALYTVIGVVEPRFTGLNPGSSIGLVVPVSQVPQFPETGVRGAFNIWADFFARRAPGVSLEQVRARLAVVGPRMLEGGMPSWWNPQQRRDYLSRRVMVGEVGSAADGEWFVQRFGTPLYAFWGICGLVLGVACVSLATLLLARGVARRTETRVRLSLGGSRMAVFRLFAAECLLLVLGGAGLALVLAPAANAIVAARVSQIFRMTFEPGLDSRAFALLVGLVVAVIALMSPVIAWQVRRFGRGGLSQSERGTTRSGTRSQKLLLAGQVALTLAIVAIAGLMAASIRHVYRLDLGIRTNDLAMAMLRTDPSSAGRPPDGRYYAELLDRVSTVPGVIRVALSEVAPFWSMTRSERIAVVDGALPEVDARTMAVTDTAFDALGIPIVAGERFRGPGAESTTLSAVVSRSLADRLGGQSIIGKHLRIGRAPNTQLLRVIGIAGNAQLSLVNPDERAPLVVFVNFWEHPRRQAFSTLLLKTVPDVNLGVAPLANVVRSLGREYVGDFRTVGAAKDDALIENRALAVVSVGFAVFALLLAAAGLFGLLSYHVSMRRPEIGVRMALGARPHDVRWLVVREAVPVVAGGGVVGLALALGIGQLISGLVYGLGAQDPVLLAASALLLLSTAAVAAWSPARRASRVDPVLALRSE
jgi:predicted permease